MLTSFMRAKSLSKTRGVRPRCSFAAFSSDKELAGPHIV